MTWAVRESIPLTFACCGVYCDTMPKKPATPEPSPPSWAERVAALCARYQLTQADLGKRVGVQKSVVSKWVHGTQVPPISVQKLLAKMERGDDLVDVSDIGQPEK